MGFSITNILCLLCILGVLCRGQPQHSTALIARPPLIPSDPEKVMVIRKVSSEILTCSVPFARFGQLKIGGRGTIVRMANGHLVVFSPNALTNDVKAHISAMGEVRYLIAPDIQHHLFLGPWHVAYPSAKLIGPDELRTKLDKEGQKLPWTYLWTKDKKPSVNEEFDKEFEYTFVTSHPNRELVFNHKPTRTLIQADLWFNLPATEQYSKSGISPTKGYLTKAFIFINSSHGTGTWQKLFTWYWMSSNDRPSFNKNIHIINSWNFDRMIPCHGDVIDRGAKATFRKVFSWHLQGQRTMEAFR